MRSTAHSPRGIKIIGATLTPFGNETYMANALEPAAREVRTAVNKLIRGAAFDGGCRFRPGVCDEPR